MEKPLKWISITIVALLLGAVMIRAVSKSRRDPPAQDEDEEQTNGPSRVSLESGRVVVTLNAGAEKRAGIAIETLQKARSREETTAPARVLSTGALATMRNQYVSDENQAKKAEIAAGVERREYQRLKRLYAENQNASAKAMQAAQGRLQSDQADLATARQQLELVRAAVRQSWGSVVAEWVASGGPSLDQVLDQQDELVEVTIPVGQKDIRPRRVLLEIPAGGSVTADLVSPFPRVDPRIQGVSLLYLAPARPGLIPGAYPTARYAAGGLLGGVVVPRSAVVWWQGSAWAYQEIEPGHFSRRPVPTGTPVRGGYFVTQDLAPGDKIVSQGAQMVLSTELAPQRENAGGEDTD
jgi:hypothetical protein